MSLFLAAWALLVLAFWLGVLLDFPRRWPKRQTLRAGRSANADGDDGDIAEIDSAQAADVRWVWSARANPRPPAALIRSMRDLASERDYQLVSVLLRRSAKTLGEQLLVPFLVWVFQLRFPFRRVGKKGSRVAAAVDDVLLVSRECLEGRDEPFGGTRGEALNLAKEVKRAGGGVWLGLCEEMTLESNGVRDTMRSLSDSRQRSGPQTLVALFVSLGFFVAPPILVVTALVVNDSLTGLASTLAWAIQAWLISPVLRFHRVPPRFAMLVPLAALVAVILPRRG